MAHSLNKGKTFEREIAKKLQELGFKDARRTSQWSGKVSADVDGLDGFHIECKRRRFTSPFLRDTWKQIDDDRNEKSGILFWRADRGEIHVDLRLSDLKQLVDLFANLPKE